MFLIFPFWFEGNRKKRNNNSNQRGSGLRGIVDGCWESLLPPPLPSANSLNLMNNAVRNTADKEIVVSLSSIYGQYVITHAHVEKENKKRFSPSNCTAAPKWMIASLLATLTVSSLKKKEYLSLGSRDATRCSSMMFIPSYVTSTWIVAVMNSQFILFFFFFSNEFPPFFLSFVVEDLENLL